MLNLEVMKKLRTTTPASLSTKAKRAFLVVAAVVLAGTGVGYQLNKPVSADQYDDKIRALQADMARYKAEADRLGAEAATLANAVAQLNNEKNALQAQINVNQAQHDKLVIQIAETEKEIKDNQDALGITIADLYVDDSISPVEMLASSQNIGDFLDKQEYRNSVKDELGATIKRVKDLKVQLSTQKEEVTKVLESQKTARDTLAAKQAEQATLLARTQNDESKYQGMIKDRRKLLKQSVSRQSSRLVKTPTVATQSLTVDSLQITHGITRTVQCSDTFLQVEQMVMVAMVAVTDVVSVPATLLGRLQKKPVVTTDGVMVVCSATTR